LHLETLEDRQLLAGASYSERPDLGPITGSLYRETDTLASQPVAGGNNQTHVPGDALLAGYDVEPHGSFDGRSSSDPAYPSQKSGESATEYYAPTYVKMEPPSSGRVIAELPRIQPFAGTPERTQRVPAPVLPTPLAVESPNDVRTLAAVGLAGVRTEVQPLPRLEPNQTAAELGTPWLPLLPATAEDSSDQGVPERPATDSGSPIGTLLTGLVSIDQAALERAVDKFFHQLDHLGEDLTETCIDSRLTPWLAAAAVSTAAYAFARHQLQPSHRDGTGRCDDGRDQEWAWFTACAILPSEDKP
jgi:hypothetical protein